MPKIFISGREVATESSQGYYIFKILYIYIYIFPQEIGNNIIAGDINMRVIIGQKSRIRYSKKEQK